MWRGKSVPIARSLWLFGDLLFVARLSDRADVGRLTLPAGRVFPPELHHAGRPRRVKGTRIKSAYGPAKWQRSQREWATVQIPRRLKPTQPINSIEAADKEHKSQGAQIARHGAGITCLTTPPSMLTADARGAGEKVASAAPWA